VNSKGLSRHAPHWALLRFGTVRPRVQIPGPRPISEYDCAVAAHLARAPDHSRITISRGSNPEIGSWDTIQIVRA